MAKLICSVKEKVLNGSRSLAPCEGIFQDVPASNSNCPYIEGIYRAGIASGCQSSPRLFCPENNAAREEMAKFMVNEFGLSL